MASRKASQMALEASPPPCLEMLGGSADLTGSNLTNTKSTPNLRFDDEGKVVVTEDKPGRHINYGVREFGMAAIMNGVALHGGFIPYGGTFLTFSDYSRNAIRMAALMKQRVVHVFTHDSIGLGEDGPPTHQSIEHAASLRLIPAWTSGARRHHRNRRGLEHGAGQQEPPLGLLLSRQNLPYAPKQPRCRRHHRALCAGRTRRRGHEEKAQAVIIATGSESSWPCMRQAAGRRVAGARGLHAQHHRV